MPFAFNALELYVVTINEKPWMRAREVCKALTYEEKTANIVKNHCSKENYTQKYQMNSVPAADTPVDWPKVPQKFDIYINEEGVYELLFSSQQRKAKDFRRHCFNVLFPHARQKLSYKSHAMKIEDLTGHAQALDITNEAHRQETLRLNEEHEQTMRKRMQQLHCLMMIYKIMDIKKLHCKHKEMTVD